LTASLRKFQFIAELSLLVLAGLAGPSVLAQAQPDSVKTILPDSVERLLYPWRPNYRLRDRYGDPFSNYTTVSPFFLKEPSSFKKSIEMDTGMRYNINEKVGKLNFRPPTSMTFKEYTNYTDGLLKKSYYQSRSKSLDGESAVSNRGLMPKIYISPVLDRIFGGSYVELVPRGFVTLDFGGSFQRIQNPAIPARQQRNGGFEFDQQINLSVTGKIGEKMKVTTNFDNNNSFDFQNQMKIEYTGFKEDILKKLEIGNVSLPLNNSLIYGAQNLFGLKAQMQFGKLLVTSIATTQRGKQSSVNVSGSGNGTSQGRPFEIVGSNYDENRHFFLGQFFRDNFEGWLSTLPQITSGVNVTRVEVYLVNRNNDTQTIRNLVAFMDMGETNKIYNKKIIPDAQGAFPTNNDFNNLFDFLTDRTEALTDALESTSGLGMVAGTDFEKITSTRKLSPTEFTINKELGYITLQRKLQNDEALAVAYEYTYNGRPFKVGELSEDYSNLEETDLIFMKLLRPRKISIKDKAGKIIPTWDLMMKNIYNLNVTQLTRDAFQLRIIYRDDRSGIDNPQLQEGDISKTKQLIQVFGLDRLNPYNDPQPDGNFDFVEKITVNTETGLIIFPTLEPFNTSLRQLFATEPNPTTRQFLTQKYVYDTLYRTTKAEAELVATKNKFWITGTFKAGSGRDIIIQGFNISQGSVKVYAGGTPLQEGSDYQVDYTFGKVTILNEGVLSSGKDINVTYEQQDPFSFQTRSLLGSRFDYSINEDFNLGATMLYYNERPLISRNLIGTEPARNFQYGLDMNYKKNSRVLTKIVDALPFIQTKEPSSITFSGEFAQLLPGTSNIVQGTGTSFIDDFENTVTPYNLQTVTSWRLSSIPEDINFDPSPNFADNNIEAGFRRAKLAWYQIDNLWYREGGRGKPDYLSTEKVNGNQYTRRVQPQEIFPGRDLQIGNFNEPILDLAYYPAERGAYNYNPDLNLDGTLKNPRQNWAGITTAIKNEVDFDKSNIEYIEFWLMDPFADVVDDGRGTPQINTTGGRLIFHLGSISEDATRDGKHGFENGLPKDGDLNSADVTRTNWGLVTTQQYLNAAFENTTGSRPNQDVGMDGLSDANEATFFNSFLNNATVSPDTRTQLAADPSADDFSYFLGSDFDAKQAGILERYKNFNGVENNSPIGSNNDLYPKSNYTIPDNEDLNADNTLSDLEEYYSYSIDLRKSQLVVGNKYIVDAIPTTNNVTWYLFRIPIRQFEGKVGEINGFKSIRYIRTILTGFDQPIVLRLANFRSVGNRWRRYTNDLEDERFGTPFEPMDNFSVSAVNVEEHGRGNDVKPAYVTPLARDRDNTSTVERRLNEQAVQMCVDELEDGDGRAIYKNVSFDFFNYGRLKMFLSAYGQDVKDDDLTAFVRLGTDFDENYYEVELPLKMVDPKTVDKNNPPADAIWPEANNVDLDLNELYALKAQRDRESFSLDQLYPDAGPRMVDDRQGIRLRGRPDLSQVRLMMIGVRNKTSTDKRSFTFCLWANELRLTDFDRTAGWAVNAVASAKLADLGTVSGSYKHISFGYGGVQSKIYERARGETNAYDVSANMNVDKLLPKWLGLKLPVYASYERAVINPKFDPANPDTRLEAAFKSFNTDEERQTFLKVIQDVSIRRSLNFTNVKRVKLDPKAKQHIYDIENFSFNYAFSEATRTNFNLQENTQRNIRGGVAWQYTSKFKGIEPFQDAKWASAKSLQLIKDFNFNPLPTSISVRGDLDRSFNKIVYRNASTEISSSLPNFQKYFVFNRSYNVKWNLSKALSLDYNSRVVAIIDEPDGDLENDSLRQIVKDNLKKLGRTKNFDQNITANYTLPLDKIPVLNWIGADYRYNVGYSWRAGPLEKVDSLKLGNVIQNNTDAAISGKLDFLKLYNKIKFLKDINTPKRPLTPQEKAKQAKAKPDTVKKPPNLYALKGILRTLMAVRNINGTYTLTQGTVLPGFTPEPKYFGMSERFQAPGWGFVLGSQDPNIRFRATRRENDWITKNPKLTMPFSQIQNKDLTMRANVEPASELKVQLDLKKSSMSSFQEIFRFDPAADDFNSLSPSLSGSYKVSILTINTAFRFKNNASLNSSAFRQFEVNRTVMQQRFRDATGGREYNEKSQDVLIPAFLAAYTGKDANTSGLSPFPNLPLPNWRLDYNGLSKIEALKGIFQSVTISHAYSSTYSVMNFSNSLEYRDVGINVPLEDYNRKIFASVLNSQQSYIPVYVISQVMISEQFQPLIGINVRTQSKMTMRLDYKTKRDLALNISNSQVTELASRDISAEVGFTKNNMKLPWRDQGRIITIKNDVTFRMNVSYTNNRTIQRKIEDVNTITNGNVNFQLRPNISYVANQKLTTQFYYEYNFNDPLVSSSFKRSTTRFGIKILFNLAQ
jgi:cell surface protein SprA